MTSVMTEQQARRLLTLATYLRTRVIALNMRSYACGVWSGSSEIDIHTCGTTACALGWATVVWPETFSLYVDRVSGTRQTARLRVDGRPRFCTDRPIQEFFGLSYIECVHAFGDSAVRTSVQEADILEQLARDKGWVLG